MTDQQWMELALYAGARDAGMIGVCDIPFDAGSRNFCAKRTFAGITDAIGCARRMRGRSMR